MSSRQWAGYKAGKIPGIGMDTKNRLYLKLKPVLLGAVGAAGAEPQHCAVPKACDFSAG